MKSLFLSLIFLSLGYLGFGQTVTTDAANPYKQTTATLNAHATGLNSSKTYYVKFYYDVTSGGYSNLATSSTFTGGTSASFTADISGLTANTKYYFTAYLYESNPPPGGDTYVGSGGELNFTTLTLAAPTVTIPSTINNTYHI